MRFVQKPVKVEAMQWHGDNGGELAAWLGWPVPQFAAKLIIPTLEGEMTAFPGDWIIRGPHGGMSVSSPFNFPLHYEAIE